MRLRLTVFVVLVSVLVLFTVGFTTTSASNNCNFINVGAEMRLTNNCTTTATIYVPQGRTLNGQWYQITAIDPVGGSFNGAVVENAPGATQVNIRSVRITASALQINCAVDLAGIRLYEASGTIENNQITNLNQANSGCQLGNSIEVYTDFPGATLRTVVIRGNTIRSFMKTGILVDGNVRADIRNNVIGASANQAVLAANSIQVGSGASGGIHLNQIAGNSWTGDNIYAATAIIIFDTAPGFFVRNNGIQGNADVGILVYSNNASITLNGLNESGPDGFFDEGIYICGTGNTLSNNGINGYTTPVFVDSYPACY
jgi:hypothetical protein